VTDAPEVMLGSIVASLIATAVLSAVVWMIWNLVRRRVSSTRRFASPIPLHARLRNLASTANRRPRFSTPQTAIRQASAYEVWDGRLPTTGKVLEQVKGLARSNVQFSGLLVSTHPPTIKVMEGGSMPIVTRLIPVGGFDSGNLNQTIPEELVATFHTHRSDLSIFEHDEQLFKLVDAFAGPKIHVIGAVRGLRFYRARDGPALVTRDRLEVK